jgi:hypothetical protein
MTDVKIKHSTPEEAAAFRNKFIAAMQKTEPKDWPLPWPTLPPDHRRLETLRDKPEITADEYVSAAEAALVSFVSTRIARREREEAAARIAELEAQLAVAGKALNRLLRPPNGHPYIEAATKEEWAVRAMNAEAKLLVKLKCDECNGTALIPDVHEEPEDNE